MSGRVLAAAVTAQGRIVRGLLGRQQLERRQVVLQMRQSQFALQRGDVARRLAQA